MDPVFDVTITRVSDAAAHGVGWISTEYPPVSAWNCDSTLLVLIHVSHFSLYDRSGFVKDLSAVSASSEPRWSRTDADLLYFHDAPGNVLKSLHVATGEITTIRAFPEYASIDGLGESDISLDGDHMVFCGQDSSGNPSEVFVYTIPTDTKGQALDVAGHDIDSLYITGANDVLISWNPPYPALPTMGDLTYKGMELFNGDTMAFERTLANANGHKALCLGGTALAWTTSNENPVTLPDFHNAIVLIDLATGKQTGLVSLDWSLAVHISAPATSPWVIVETYAAPTAPWVLYSNELLRVWTDGSGRIDRVCQHGSVAANYNGQPKATISRDGSELVFASNMGRLTPVDYCDVYRIAVAA